MGYGFNGQHGVPGDNIELTLRQGCTERASVFRTERASNITATGLISQGGSISLYVHAESRTSIQRRKALKGWGGELNELCEYSVTETISMQGWAYPSNVRMSVCLLTCLLVFHYLRRSARSSKSGSQRLVREFFELHASDLSPLPVSCSPLHSSCRRPNPNQ